MQKIIYNNNELIFFLELLWESIFSPLYHSTDMLISLPGNLLYFYLNLTKVLPTYNLSATVHWIFNKYNDITFKIQAYSEECELLKSQSETCSTFVNSNGQKKTTYFIIGHSKYHSDWQYIQDIRIIRKSWNEASDICAKIGAYLPYFNSKADMDEFTALMKQSLHVPVMEMVFIGLHSISGKVGRTCIHINTIGVVLY